MEILDTIYIQMRMSKLGITNTDVEKYFNWHSSRFCKMIETHASTMTRLQAFRLSLFLKCDFRNLFLYPDSIDFEKMDLEQRKYYKPKNLR